MNALPRLMRAAALAAARAAPELDRNALVEVAHQMLQSRDIAKGGSGTGCGTDASFAATPGGTAGLEGPGLPGHGTHASDELIDLDAVVPRVYPSTRPTIEMGKE